MYKIFLSLMVFNLFCQLSSISQVSQNLNRTFFGSSYFQRPDTFSTSLTSQEVLSSFLLKRVKTYLSQSTDLSPTRLYAVLDNTDKRLFIGGVLNKFNSANNPKWIATLGIKANIEDNFSLLFDDNGFSNDLGISFKLTRLFSGNIKYKPKYINLLESKRELLGTRIRNAFLNDIQDYGKNIQGGTNYVTTNEISNYSNTQQPKYIKQFIEEEASVLEEKKWYGLAFKHWLSVEAYIPVTNSKEKVATSLNNPLLKEVLYRPWQFDAVYTIFIDLANKRARSFPFRGVTLISFKGSLINNNSIINEDLETYNYDKYLAHSTVVDTNFLTKLKTDKYYVGDYKKFVTPALSTRIVRMFYPFIGLSAVYELRFNDKTSKNWRLGIPISLIDKEGERNINFEIVWKEINKNHSIGLNIGLPIGKNIF